MFHTSYIQMLRKQDVVQHIFRKIKSLVSFQKKFNKQELNYSIVEKEFLSIILALNNKRILLIGAHITILTDNKNLIYYNSIQTNRIQRWKCKLMEYDIEIKHVYATKNAAADSLSRCCNIKHSKQIYNGKYTKNNQNY